MLYKYLEVVLNSGVGCQHNHSTTSSVIAARTCDAKRTHWRPLHYTVCPRGGSQRRETTSLPLKTPDAHGNCREYDYRFTDIARISYHAIIFKANAQNSTRGEVPHRSLCRCATVSFIVCCCHLAPEFAFRPHTTTPSVLRAPDNGVTQWVECLRSSVAGQSFSNNHNDRILGVFV